ncbi:SCO1664 family protein, partial [Pedococcus sp.]|uniref:SCO1664 family protein n=1 Tax=Pedococcus sp. TaxID=2860345 RepID=UPI002E13F29D|nr:SCO1664 family protein [Pedococcus sp.]
MPVLRWPPRDRGAHLPPRERLQALTEAQASSRPPIEVLAEDDVEVLGRLVDASNLALLVRVGGVDGTLAIYKPVAGERPLWDFPDGTLAAREVAAWLVSSTGGWGIVPETVLRTGPQGTGSIQRWVGDPESEPEYAVTLVRPGAVPPGWLPVLEGEDANGRPVVLVHEDSPGTRAVAAFDAVINNSDRKGSHLVREGGALRGFDHGVSLHEEDKLRTVFWGFAGQPLAPQELDRISTVHDAAVDASSALRLRLDEL